MVTKQTTGREADRRLAARREAQAQPLPFPDRRQGDRRTGTDRRAPPLD